MIYQLCFVISECPSQVTNTCSGLKWDDSFDSDGDDLKITLSSKGMWVTWEWWHPLRNHSQSCSFCICKTTSGVAVSSWRLRSGWLGKWNLWAGCRQSARRRLSGSPRSGDSHRTWSRTPPSPEWPKVRAQASQRLLLRSDVLYPLEPYVCGTISAPTACPEVHCA